MPRPNQYSEPSTCACGKTATKTAMVMVYGQAPSRRMTTGKAIKLCEECFRANPMPKHIGKSLLTAFSTAVSKRAEVDPL